MNSAAETPELFPLPLVQQDAWLAPFEPVLRARQLRLARRISEIEASYGSLARFATAHQRLGLQYDARRRGHWFREWAPQAQGLFLVGDFNFWNREATPLQRGADGVWEVFVPDQPEGGLVHGSRYKVHVVTTKGAQDRLPATLRRAVQNPQTHDFAAQVWRPDQPFAWTDQKFRVGNYVKEPFIYEAHVGMATEEAKVGSYLEFAEQVLPRVQALGYNCVQLMAVMEHPYYGSFGYHVANFFAVSSRFGTPEELKHLINEAHRRGMAVLLDVVHSHAVKNEAEGLADFDGSGGQYFHAGKRGEHPGWDSRLFDYGKPEVQQFLLSNLRYWLEEFHFDGFRFDGITSMLYQHHGEGVAFSSYDQYFGPEADEDAILYLQLASTLVKGLKRSALLIAEDMSGMPGLCRPIAEGGIGFDYRLGMGIPDYWIKLLKHTRDEDWNLGELWYTLTNRRAGEKTVAYAESHDQALVGDKTLSHWLMDARLYSNMHRTDPDLVVERGMALHKLIRLITLALGGEAYLNFIGNEFGHPEWVDFPRAGNSWSYQHARRQWSLADNPDLKYSQLLAFDKAMVGVVKVGRVLSASPRQLNLDPENQVLIFERGGLVFVFSFHVSRSIPDYRFLVSRPGGYRVVLTSDAVEFGGFSRVDDGIRYETFGEQGRQLSLYVTNRTALVLARC
ncbi:alpha amylase C-terminal domain-containing protein [Hymenobacter sp. BT175]|uniref:alpha-amylase family glycosyl hydrolase n=1 Tax=Hymenobacter translucens TaxID=2886507 RepID=UPI001D0EEC1A|nr:alpha-amylase family glycosyl hydrolase [Hymenobacter translucens]MCC2547150.1 alpha amylase C-terminal domain-containing protein [Hymenobacter translucens]